MNGLTEQNSELLQAAKLLLSTLDRLEDKPAEVFELHGTVRRLEFVQRELEAVQTEAEKLRHAYQSVINRLMPHS